jgi:hypothetical protein
MDIAPETDTTPSPSRPIRRDEVPALLAELERSGEGIASLCRRRGLLPWRLYDAKRRTKRGAKSASGATRADLAPVRVIDPASETATRGARSAPPLRIRLDPTPSIEVRPDFDAATLHRLLEVLRSC